MKKILLLQFRNDSSAQYEIGCFNRFSDGSSTIFEPLNSLNKDINWQDPKSLVNSFNGVILGGSGEFCFSGRDAENDKNFELALKNTSPLVKLLIEKDIPTLGICFGHQLIGHHLGTKVERDKSQSKSGSFHVSLTDSAKNDPLFNGLPEKFIAQYGHKDSLRELPNNTKLLASGGDKCRTSSLKHKNNIYTVQFHPEMNKDDLLAKVDIYSDYIDDLDEFTKSLKDSDHAPKIINNFIEKIAK